VEVAHRGRAAHLLAAARWQSPAVNRRGPAPGTAAHPWRLTGGGLVRPGRTALRSAPLVCALVVGALLAGTATAAAAPPPTDPGDGALSRSRAQVTERAAEVGQLTGRLAELDARTDDLQADLAARREDAASALDDLTAAQAAAAEAARRADEAGVATDAASSAVDDARARMDVFVSATYQEGLDTGPFGLLTGAQNPADLVARAEYSEIVARSELAARDGLERARVARANAESTAKAARAEAEARRSAAAAAKQASDTALAAADAAAQENVRALAEVDAQRAAVQAQLDAAEAHDSVLHAQRDRFRAWQRQMAAEQAAREEAARREAADRLARLDRPGRPGRPPVFTPPLRGGGVQRAIDRALSQVGVQYVWGGGNGRGPTTGIPDAFGSPLNRIGFDCSGLMLYAYSGTGVALPRVSRNQFNAGRKVPVSQLRPGDLVFYKRGGRPIHHVAMYIGRGNMVEAPYTGANVRVVPLRRAGLMPQATRLI
jgi:peptidoglycan DL-endopeptidase RipA